MRWFGREAKEDNNLIAEYTVLPLRLSRQSMTQQCAHEWLWWYPSQCMSPIAAVHAYAAMNGAYPSVRPAETLTRSGCSAFSREKPNLLGVDTLLGTLVL